MNWLEALQETYCPNGSFSYASPKHIRLFPYTTSAITATKTIDELNNFYGICGETLRNLVKVDNDIACTPSAIISDIRDKIETQNFADLEHIIKTTIFDENKQIFCFHPSLFYHLSILYEENRIAKLAHYICDILFDGHTELSPSLAVTEEQINVFHSLILKNLPPLNSKKTKKGGNFYKAQDPLRDCFIHDCTFLKQDKQLYAAQLPQLLKFYFFMYQIRLVESLNSFFKDHSQQPFYFSVDWESLSKGRQAFQAGWKRVEPKFITMWSHTQCLEMINYIKFEGIEPPFSYSDIKLWANTVDQPKKQKASGDINAIISFYRQGIEHSKFDWSTFDSINKIEHIDGKNIEDSINYLFKMIHFQFELKKKTALRYSKWLSQFVADSYLKRRGPLGNTLCLSRTQLLFLTRLCIGSNPEGKLRLTELWKEFSKRGVAFDFESQKQIVILFNKLNLIEKKSDSGDAQYVCAIF